MFADSLLETSPSQRVHRGWMTLTSFGLQACVLGLLMLVPILRPEGLPLLRRLSPAVVLSAPAPPPAQPPSTAEHIAQSNLANGIMILPRQIPNHIDLTPDDPARPPFSGPYIPGAPTIGGGELPYSPIGVGTAPPPALAPRPAPTARPIRISRIMEGNLIVRVQPVYPPLARSARIQGQVVLSAIISKAGVIENLHVLSGHPMLVGAALDAVKQWRYRPYILNDEPIEVETQITVNFSLSGS